MDRKMLMTEIPAVGDTSSGAGQGTGNGGPGYHWDTLPTLYWLPENWKNRPFWLKACSARVRELPPLSLIVRPRAADMGVQRRDTALVRDPALDSQGTNRAGLSAFSLGLGPAESRNSAEDCPSHQKLHLGMAIAFFPKYFIFFLIKKEKVFLNKINTLPKQSP